MTEARLETSWDHTSALLTLLANAHRDPKKRAPFRVEDFHPFRRRRGAGVRITAENIRLLKKVFVDPKSKEKA